jgi:hypothetical protein
MGKQGLSDRLTMMKAMWSFKKKPSVVVRPSIPEWEERPRDYEELVSSLRRRGLKARLAENKGLPSGSDLPSLVPEAFAVFVGAKVADAILGTIIEEMLHVIVNRAKLRWSPKRTTVRGIIYGPHNEILHEVTFEATTSAILRDAVTHDTDEAFAQDLDGGDAAGLLDSAS